MTDAVTPPDFQAQLDAAIAQMQSAEASMEARVTQMIDAQRTVMDSLQAKLAAQAPHIDISTELDALNSIASNLVRFEAAVGPTPAPDLTTSEDPAPINTSPQPADSSTATTSESGSPSASPSPTADGSTEETSSPTTEEAAPAP